ncbi:alpha/beta hydrolase [Microbacterium xanthum]|uniref:alpha/beta hydrolase n=1 Tax=Microbacterium xanthum TaxID=3079794 RepID=UPI002AD3A0F0|nr:alpha/beta hydrolase [Microbacterium sp. KSW-48]MDZ8170817.1 alpha/beta hydrolase [Microbacterium sp. KSW-48]
MDIDRIDPTLRAATRRVPRFHLENPLYRRAMARLTRVSPGTRVPGVARRTVRTGGVRLRVYTPRRPAGGALLWLHGGGLVMGAPAMDDRLCGVTAARTGAVVVSVDYRVAPRHPFPAALDDAAAGFTWLDGHAGEVGIDRGRIAVGGQSAGGGIAAALVQRLHDEGAAVAAQWLWCPMLDDRTAADRSRDAVDHPVWNNRSNLVGWRAYLGDGFGRAEGPPYAAAARRDDLRGLPPAWVYTTDIELFHDEDVAYADRLRQAGVDVTLDVVSGAPHGFESWAWQTDLASELVDRATAWLAARLDTASA